MALLLFLGSDHLSAQAVDVYSRPVQKERPRQFDALHYQIEISIDDKTNSFEGSTTVSLLPFENGFRRAVLHAGMFIVTRVEDKKGELLSFEQQSEKLTVYFPKPYTSFEVVQFTVYYHADNLIDSTGQTRGMNFMPANARHPAQIFTRSFPRGARNWFPCYDEPNDKATMDIIATVRSDYELLSNGRLVAVMENKSEKTRTFYWAQEQPHSTYLSVIMAAPYTVIRDSLGSLPVNYWVYPNDVKYVPSTFPRTPEIIALFNKEYGFDYPWAKYDQATIAGIGGGAETTSASELGEGVMHDERAEQDFSGYSWLICHEAAHQWWGDLITCRDWTHTWLNESFGTYSEVQYALHDKGENDAAVNVLGKKNEYLREAHTRYMRPVVFDRWNEPGDNFDRHTYQKGAVLIHHLRWLLGEKDFHAVLSSFLTRYAFRAPDTRNFMDVVNEVSGKNMDWYFEDWFLRPGHPVFDVRYQWNQRKKTVLLTVNQTQDTVNGRPVFRSPMDIRIVDAKGSRVHRVTISKRDELFELPSSGKPLMVRFDEGNHWLKEWTFQKTTDELLYQLKNDDVIGKMWAIEQLVNRNDKRVIAAFREAAAKDKLWSVRRDALYRLAGFRGIVQMDLDRNLIQTSRLDSVQMMPGIDRPSMITFFKKMAVDPHSQVRAAALYGLGNFQAREEIDFLKERYRKDDSYVAQGAILRALGKCGDASVVSMLKEAEQLDSPRNVLRSSARWAISKLVK
jgi:aminopeptidase N